MNPAAARQCGALIFGWANKFSRLRTIRQTDKFAKDSRAYSISGHLLVTSDAAVVVVVSVFIVHAMPLLSCGRVKVATFGKICLAIYVCVCVCDVSEIGCV